LGHSEALLGHCPAAVFVSTWNVGRRAASRCLELVRQARATITGAAKFYRLKKP
jgi:hypothetical protein